MDKIDSIYDILIDINGIEPNEIEVINVINGLPNSILEIAEEWGYYDTEFREKVYEWIKNNYIK